MYCIYQDRLHSTILRNISKILVAHHKNDWFIYHSCYISFADQQRLRLLSLCQGPKINKQPLFQISSCFYAEKKSLNAQSLTVRTSWMMHIVIRWPRKCSTLWLEGERTRNVWLRALLVIGYLIHSPSYGTALKV